MRLLIRTALLVGLAACSPVPGPADVGAADAPAAPDSSDATGPDAEIDVAPMETGPDAADASLACETPWVCNGRCVDLGTDPEHCGACGRACGTGCVCRSLTCYTPDGGALCFR
jgi:hypothetical protein